MENKLNKTEQKEAWLVIDQMIDHFDVICDMLQHGKLNLDGRRKDMVYYSIIGLQQIYDQIEFLEKLKARHE
jgi:hypothetical protein